MKKISGEMLAFWGLVIGLALYGWIKVRPSQGPRPGVLD